MLRKFLLGTVAAATFAAAAPASAAIYTYNTSSGAVLTINTTTMTGSLIGGAINATFSGAGLAGFTGGFNIPTFGTDITIAPTSTWVQGGVTYIPNQNHQQMIEMGNYPGMVGAGTNKLNLWSYWGTAACPKCNYLGDFITTVVSTSTGGTSVPEPGMLGLMGASLIGLAYLRRRRMPAAQLRRAAA